MPQTQFELRRKLLQLEALYDVGRALNTLRPEGELLEELMQRAISVLDAMIGFAASLDDKLHPQHFFALGMDVEGEALFAQPIVKQVVASREPVSVTAPKIVDPEGGDLLLAPMVAGDSVVGL